ncbi:LuxR C-terminal-related transcriptional regulator [Aquimonas voraii]|uniref:Two component transcriptional regulator, LuxR family n=1 Tax=Aquimonas voraii TaxID=265719 RepID=A0A1G6S6D0_9GAMM|nr:response regulator transcription factor [Aquimonas voraii]SDD12244.1 two component transcriptional regulator, LuxR family [Aquimonas voraii]
MSVQEPGSTSPRSALLVDDLAPARAWLRAALSEAFAGIDIHEAGDIAEANRVLARLPAPPALALIDLGLPDGNGTRIIESLQRSGAATLCVVSTVFDDDAHVFPALRAGAQGYVLKDLPARELARMLRGILDGQPPLSPSIARRLLRQFQRPETPANTTASEALTAREAEVLQLIAKGYTVQQTAAALGLSPHTTSGYVKDIYRKLRVNSRAEATLEAAKMGLV